MQVGFSIFIFVLLSSQDGFKRDWIIDEKGVPRAPALYNGICSTVSFLLGAITSIASGFLGMKIATYANARTALEARKGIAPAFMCGKSVLVLAQANAACSFCLQCPRIFFITLNVCRYGVKGARLAARLSVTERLSGGSVWQVRCCCWDQQLCKHTGLARVCACGYVKPY